MTSELTEWLCKIEKHYFVKQAELLSEANVTHLNKKLKPSIQPLKSNIQVNSSSLVISNSNNTSSNYINNTVKKKKSKRGKGRGFEIPIDARLQLTFSQLSGLEQKKDEQKRNKEMKLPSGQGKKQKRQIEWTGSVDDMLHNYQKMFTYLNRKKRIGKKTKKRPKGHGKKIKSTGQYSMKKRKLVKK